MDEGNNIGGNPTYAVMSRVTSSPEDKPGCILDQDRRLVKMFNARLASGQSAEEVVREWGDLSADQVLRQEQL